jgi:hypothetical protein
MLLPDDWELVETSEGTPVLKLPDNQYWDRAIEPVFSSNPEEAWASTDDADTLNDLLDRVKSEEVVYEFVTQMAPACAQTGVMGAHDIVHWAQSHVPR